MENEQKCCIALSGV